MGEEEKSAYFDSLTLDEQIFYLRFFLYNRGIRGYPSPTACGAGITQERAHSIGGWIRQYDC